MSQGTFRMRRRVGGALLAGVTALGVAALAGGGVASAATTATATIASGSSVKTIAGTGATQAGGGITITVSGGVTANDVIIVTVACPSSGSIVMAGDAAGASVTDSAGKTWAVTTASNNACGVGVKNQLVYTASTTEATGPSLTVTPEYTTTSAAAGNVSLTGLYVSGTGSSSFAVPSNATVVWFSTVSNTPATIIGANSSAAAVSNVTISEPVGLSALGTVPTGDYVCLVLNPAGAVFSAAPTGTAVGAVVAAPALQTSDQGNATANGAASMKVTTAPATSQGASYTFSGIKLNTTTTSGSITAGVYINSAATCTLATNVATVGTVVLAAQQTTNQIYGPDGTADGTVATEFENAFPAASGGNKTAVLATDVDPYDALSAAYLEGQLGTGLLITPPASLGTDAANALRIEGVQTVYVVGGPDAITPAVIAQLQATPAYNAGGLTTTGSNIKVVGPIYGQTAADTAQQISTYFGAAYGSVNANGAYSASTSTSGGGAFNDTAGNSSATGPGGAVPTAIVIASNDYRDAMSIAPEADSLRLPIVLTDASTLSTQASAALTSLGVKQVIVIGGQLALSNNVVTAIQALNGGTPVLRIAGQDYTDTAGQIANFALAAAGKGLGWASTGFLVSHGDYWTDALGAAALGAGQPNSTLGTTPMPILLTQSPTVPGSYITTLLTTAGSSSGIQGNTTIGTLNFLGGPLAMPSSTISALQTALAS